MRKSLALAGLLLAAASASAAPFIELSNFRITATDLNPDDGVTASYTFTAGSYFLDAMVNFDPNWSLNISLAPGETGQLVLDHPTSHHLASFDGNTLRTSIDHHDGLARVQAGSWSSFTATPYTRLTFSYDYMAMNSFIPGSVSSQAMMRFVNSDWTLNEGTFIDAFPYWGDPQKGVFSFELDIGADGLQDGSMFTQLTSFGWSKPAVAVPEPGSAALLLAGLAGLAALRRRKR